VAAADARPHLVDQARAGARGEALGNAILYIISVVAVAGIGLGVGIVAALAVKTAARGMGCLVIVGFVALEVLGYYGLVHVDWASLSRPANLAAGYAEAGLQRIWTLLSYNVPFSIGFALGFLRTLQRG